MSDDTDDDGEYLLATIIIRKMLSQEHGILLAAEASTPDGGDVALIDTLGMLRLAEDSLIRAAMGEDE